MSEPLAGVVVCHGELAAGFISAVEGISGVTDALKPVSNSDCDRGLLERRISEAVGDQPAVLFVDMAAGSCLFAALTRVRAQPNTKTIKVVTGVNLAMLVDFVFHRDLDAEAAAARAVEIGQRAIKVP
jgi:mannose/fructose-specific phosphotransferase system component IIA